MQYTPIETRRAPGFKDVIVSISSEAFDSAGALSFLKSYSETITAAASYYSPFNEGLSSSSEVNYFVQRSYTTLAENPFYGRHNGDTVDLEITIDDYHYIQAKPIIAAYSSSPALPKLVSGDYYNKTSTRYIYNGLSVPRSSNQIWDGRYLKCVDEEGNEVDSRSRVDEVRQAVRDVLENPDAPYAVVNLGGRGTTVYPPTSDPYKTTFGVLLDEFIATHYSALGLSKRPRGLAESDIYVETPLEGVGATGRYEYAEGYVAAVLDGPYFVRWANVYKYKEVIDTSKASLEEIYPCSHIIGEYDVEGDPVITLGDRCGVEAPVEGEFKEYYKRVYKSWGYVAPGEYNYTFSIPVELTQQCRRVQSALAEILSISTSARQYRVQGVPNSSVIFPYETITTVSVDVFYFEENDSEPLYVDVEINWKVKCATQVSDQAAWYLDDLSYVDDISYT